MDGAHKYKILIVFNFIFFLTEIMQNVLFFKN